MKLNLLIQSGPVIFELLQKPDQDFVQNTYESNCAIFIFDLWNVFTFLVNTGKIASYLSATKLLITYI